MSADVITNLAGSLDAELEKARETLRGVDDSIKKLFGKEASELNYGGSRPGGRRPIGQGNANHERLGGYEDSHSKSSDFSSSNHNWSRSKDGRRGESHSYGGFPEEEPMEKRRRYENPSFGQQQSSRPPPIVIGPRFKPRFDDEPPQTSLGDRVGRRLQSRIVSSTREKSREEVLAEQSGDRKGRDRNKRMFGALLGTLQRFKQEETQLKDKEEKRAQIEAKLDEAAKQERETVKLEKQQLIRDRKLKLTEIKRLEIKRRRIAELEQWEAKTKYLTNFIRTEAKPPIFFKPKILNPIMECRLEQSKQLVTEMIASKRKLVLEGLEGFEERSRRYWEKKLDGHAFRRSDVDPMDQDIEDELKELMKNEELAEVTTSEHPEPEDFTVTVFRSPEKRIKSEPNGKVEGDEDSPSKMEDEVHPESKVEEEEAEVENFSVKIQNLKNESPADDGQGQNEEEEDSIEPQQGTLYEVDY